MSIKTIISIASAKGGVGKSTITAGLAVYLSKKFRVGILDADIYGPNQHILFNVEENKPQVLKKQENKFFKPIVSNNIELMSMGFVLNKDESLTWRGPMLSSAIKQLNDSTLWSDLDFLLIDMPPGTGDAYLTVSKEIKPHESILITTPNKLSISDTLKSRNTLEKLNIKVSGYIINNISNLCENFEDKKSEFSDIECLGKIKCSNQMYSFLPISFLNKDIEFIATKIISQFRK